MASASCSSWPDSRRLLRVGNRIFLSLLRPAQLCEPNDRDTRAHCQSVQVERYIGDGLETILTTTFEQLYVVDEYHFVVT